LNPLRGAPLGAIQLGREVGKGNSELERK